MKSFNGKTILITGGGSGMGLEMAKSFAEDGAKVVITGRSKSKLEDAAKSHANISSFVCDVSSNSDMTKLRDAMEKQGGVDFLINNAGVFHSFDVKDHEYPIEKEFQEVNIDVNGVIRGVHYFLPMLMEKEDAMIMNVSSALAYVPLASAPVYSATKAFVHSYTRSLRRQLRCTHVKVIELLPPLVATPMTSDFTGDNFDMMPVDDFVAAVRSDLAKGKEEITPGQSWSLWLMSVIAPSFIFGQVNKDVQ